MAHVYFDHNATTALDARVLEAMLPWMTAQQGNATSRHAYGRAARDAVEQAREQVANAVGAYPSQVIFTASGTEANNFAINGMTTKLPNTQIAISAIEHPCVTRPAEMLQSRGFKLAKIGVDAQCEFDFTHLESLLARPTSLVSVMLANNETGAIQDIARVAELAKKHGAYMHTDAVQALGKISVNFSDLNVNAMTVSSHKIHGPQGAGALILNKRVDMMPFMLGGGQEKGLRSGTENVAAIVGFGLASELAVNNLVNHAQKTLQLRQQLEIGLHNLGATIFAEKSTRLPNTSFFAFNNIEGETLVMALDKKGFAVASGSACSSDSTEPSHVLLAMGVAPDLARGAIRVSLDASNTTEQIDQFLVTLKQELNRLKQMVAMAA
ncbi:MAG TPA: cysteine desulfurase family protein [Methylotenera sp.]|nr:cysteine desulfurase family protein [Methylotenera sp.]HPH05123.1 cysteine desulfurase family protein [Methylotenera sp.]HPN00487.1 cysteine desulfurase family protein [Methylotenera sp.]